MPWLVEKHKFVLYLSLVLIAGLCYVCYVIFTDWQMYVRADSSHSCNRLTNLAEAALMVVAKHEQPEIDKVDFIDSLQYIYEEERVAGRNYACNLRFPKWGSDENAYVIGRLHIACAEDSGVTKVIIHGMDEASLIKIDRYEHLDNGDDDAGFTTTTRLIDHAQVDRELNRGGYQTYDIVLAEPILRPFVEYLLE